MKKELPSFVKLSSESEYKEYYKNKYCKNPVTTFDGIVVKFYEERFEHAFYESSNKLIANKEVFSIERAKRIDWIEYVLQNPNSELHSGWDKKKKVFDNSRRVALITPEDYVVIIMITGKNRAKFVTAYYADNSASKIRNSPLWTP